MLMEPGELHSTKKVFGTAARYAVFMISPDAMAALAGEDAPARGGPHLARPHSGDADLFGLFAALHRSLESQATTLERQSRLAECVRRLLERHGEHTPPRRPGGGHPKVARARDYLHDHHADDVTLDDLAAAAGLSRHHLNREFSRLVGLPPHAYQVQVRLAKARGMLARGTPPARAAADAGFCDQSHLGRHLKASLGVTPRQYARAAGAA